LVISWWLTTATTTVTSAFMQSQNYNLQGQPTIQVDFINKVLEHYHSPAAGKGQALYNDGLKYGIDPAYALAFFMHESTFGTRGVAAVTHSLGNIRVSKGYQGYQGYRAYRTWEEGFEDWYKLISQLYIGKWGLTTIDQIIPIYAPGSDNNDEAAYIQSVKQAVDTWRNGTIEAS
ncbi:MAG: glucosaminidase domain-containing protein, partial [Chloroflexota bacterium]|nr:glucosaminidase domain-containing protein [Chloroflexota bacterium]